jgi:hypothetical protein
MGIPLLYPVFQHLQSELPGFTKKGKQQGVGLCNEESSLPKASSLTNDDMIPPPPSLGKIQPIQISDPISFLPRVYFCLFSF